MTAGFNGIILLSTLGVKNYKWPVSFSLKIFIFSIYIFRYIYVLVTEVNGSNTSGFVHRRSGKVV